MRCGAQILESSLVASPQTKGRAVANAQPEITFGNDLMAATTYTYPRRRRGRNHQPGGGSERLAAVSAGSIATADNTVCQPVKAELPDYETPARRTWPAP